MSLFTVDEKKCKRDGICVAVCPRLIIQQKDPDSFPTPAENAEEVCIQCGHCVAVCPQGAMSLETMKPEDCPPLDRKSILAPEEVERFVRTRRSVRSYQDRDVDTETLKRLMDIVRYAPTGMNRQEVEWLIVHTRAEVKRLSGMAVDWMRDLLEKNDPMAEQYGMRDIVNAWEGGIDIVCRGAPGLVIAHALEDFGTAPVDCTIALATLDLVAPSFGLGTCWAGFFTYAVRGWPPLRKELNLPDGHAPFYAMMIGYPKYKYQRYPLRKRPKITWRG